MNFVEYSYLYMIQTCPNIKIYKEIVIQYRYHCEVQNGIKIYNTLALEIFHVVAELDNRCKI
jgi:hypothetical protein